MCSVISLSGKSTRSCKLSHVQHHKLHTLRHLQQQLQAAAGYVYFSYAYTASIRQLNQGSDSRNATGHIRAVRAVDNLSKPLDGP
jgi:hypothetical protein